MNVPMLDETRLVPAGRRNIRARGGTRVRGTAPAGHRPARIRSVPLLLWCAVLAILGCTPIAAAESPAPQDNWSKVGFWAGERFLVNGAPQGYPATPADYWAERDLGMWTPELWDLLRRNHVPIYFHLRYGRDFGALPPGAPVRDDALPIIRQANALGIPVFGWVAVPYEAGYWGTQDNAPDQLAATLALEGWVRDNRIDLAGIAYDMEPPLSTINALTAGEFELGALARRIDPAAQRRAIERHEAVYDYARRHFARVIGAPVPWALDDLVDGDLALQNALDLWGLPDGPQALHFQVYRSTAEAIGGDPGPALIAHYLRQAQQALGPVRGQLTLGVAGEGAYRALPALVDDVRLARAMGAESIPIYSLETSVAAYGVGGVEQLVRAGENRLDAAGVQAAQQPTPPLRHYLSIMNSLDAAATAATPVVTAAAGVPQRPNQWKAPL
ncbi:hypothetical protein [Nocardia sp. NPDC052566]|uniref:hypothetical protein n=1 Tax=Nocardia sp. NPDC052566 TaxID=3364330 RepID=UPI0037C91246